MKRISIVISVFVATFSAASCAVNEECTSPSRVITAVFGPVSTRTLASCDEQSGKTASLWSAGDVIWLSDGTSVESCTLDDDDILDDGSKASIRTSLSGTVCAVYPYSAVSSPGVASLAPSLNIASSQDGTFASSDIAAGLSSDSEITFDNLVALVKFTVSSDDIRKVSFLAAGNCSINGEAALSFSEVGVPSITPSSTGGDYKGSCTSVASLSVSTAYYVAVSPATYNTISLVGYDDNGDYLFVKTRTGQTDAALSYTLSAGKVYDLGEVSSTHRGVTDSHSWAKLWDGSPAWADFNAGSSVKDYVSANGTSSSFGASPWTQAVCGSPSAWRSAWSGGRFSWDNILSSGSSSSGKWGVPSKSQSELLIDSGKTSWKWCNGAQSQFVAGCTLKGFKISGITEGYTSISIFLPASGYYWDLFGDYENVGGSGHYWTSTKGDETGYKLQFYNNKSIPSFSETDEFKFFVRPIAL